MAVETGSDLPLFSFKAFKRGALVFLGVVLAAVVVLAFFPSFTGSPTFANLASALAAIFAGAASFGVIFALLVQQREFATQRRQLAVQSEELKLAREEYARSADAQEASARLLQEQVKLMEEAREARERAAVRDRQPSFIIAQQGLDFDSGGLAASQFGALSLLQVTNQSRVSVGNVSYIGSEGLSFAEPSPSEQDYITSASRITVRVVRDSHARQPAEASLRINYDDLAGQRQWQEFRLDLLQGRAHPSRTSFGE